MARDIEKVIDDSKFIRLEVQRRGNIVITFPFRVTDQRCVVEHISHGSLYRAPKPDQNCLEKSVPEFMGLVTGEGQINCDLVLYEPKSITLRMVNSKDAISEKKLEKVLAGYLKETFNHAVIKRSRNPKTPRTFVRIL